MRYSESKEESGELLRMIIPLMSRHDAAYHPVSYAVWYEYTGGRNPSLRQELDGLLSQGTIMDDDSVHGLFDRHIAERDRKLSERLRQDLKRVLQDVTQSAAQLDAEAGEYSISLERYGDHLRRQPDAESLSDLVDSLLHDTGHMRSSVGNLREQLKSSSQEVEQLREALARAQAEALLDPLTGLLNRRGFEQAVTPLINGIDGDQPVDAAILMIDIDHFKQVNDTHGHLFGDKVIRTIAQVLRKSVGTEATVARLGGEEFAVLLPAVKVDDALAIADRVRLMVQNGTIRRVDTNETIGNITVSLGVSGLSSGDSLEQVIHRADQALYASKRNGRNRVTVRHAAP